MSFLQPALHHFSSKKGQPGDVVDRICLKGSTLVVVTFIALLTTKTFIFVNLECFHPKHFSSTQSQFATQYCYSKGTYIGVEDDDMLTTWRRDWETGHSPEVERGGERQRYIPYLYPQAGQDARARQRVPMGPRVPKKRKRISHYRIVIPALAIICLFFHIPPLIWTALVARIGGIDLNALVESGSRLEKMDTKLDHRKLVLKNIARELQRFMDSQETSFTKKTTTSHRWKNQKLFFSFLFSKVVHLFNVSLQILFLQWLTKTNMVSHSFWKLGQPLSLFNPMSEKRSNEVFPLLVYCDFPGATQIHARFLNYSVVCSMPIHMLQEFVLVLLTLFLLFLLVLIFCSVLRWIIAIQADRYRHTKSLLRQIGDAATDRQSLRDFVGRRLNPDAFFVLLLMESRCGQRTLAEVVQHLWREEGGGGGRDGAMNGDIKMDKLKFGPKDEKTSLNWKRGKVGEVLV